MKKAVKYGIGICVLLLFITLYSFIDKKNAIYDVEIPTEEFVLCDELSEGMRYSQEFISRENSLDAISIKCIVNDPTSEECVNYALYTEAGEKIREGLIDIRELESAKFNKFQFEKVTESKGKQYTFEVSSGAKEAEGISVYKTNVSNQGTDLKQNDNKVEGTLVLRTVTHRFDWETFIVVLCFVVYIVVFIRMLYKFFR